MQLGLKEQDIETAFRVGLGYLECNDSKIQDVLVANNDEGLIFLMVY